VEQNLGHAPASWPFKTWNRDTLTLAALYFNPDMQLARERAAVAQAAIITAGGRPNPTLSVRPGIPSPYLFELNFSVPIETAGKRGHRIEHAEHLSDAARLDLGNTAWTIRSRLRAALLDHLLTARDVDSLLAEERLLQQEVGLMQKRLEVGEISRPEVDAASIQLSNTRLTLLAADGRVGETRSNLAAAIGVSEAALGGIEFAWPNLEQPPAEESLSLDQLRREAVLNRLDVRRALAEYAAAEASLKLEVARQYPDIQIGPGYTYEERNNFFAVGLSLPIPVLNRNQGPIAEAEARRKQAADQLVSTQAHVVAESEAALERYRAALKEFHEADDTLQRLQRAREEMAHRAVQLGESDQLALTGVLLQGAAAARARIDALRRAQGALGALEDAVQKPLEPGARLPSLPAQSTEAPAKKEEKP
jgi:outer membrane protein TolC